MIVFNYLFLVFSGCQTATIEPPTPPVQEAQRHIAADLSGDGMDQILSIDKNQLVWGQQRYDLDGGVLHVRVGQIDDDHKETVLVVTGRNRLHPKAKAKIIQVKNDGATLLYIGSSTAERISDVRIRPNGVFMTQVGSDKVARGGWLRDGVFQEESQAIMGLQQATLTDGTVVVGRLYGDQPREHGGLEIHAKGQPPRTLPTLRGVRSLNVADIDRDGHEDILVGDGWHYRYGTEAQARVTVFRGPDFKDKRTLATIDSAYTVNHMETFPHGPDGPLSILAEASDGYYLLEQDTLSWKATRLTETGPNQSATVATGGSNTWILINGRTLGEEFPQ